MASSEPFQMLPNRLLDTVADPGAVWAYLWCRRFSNWKSGGLTKTTTEIAQLMGITQRTLAKYLKTLQTTGWMVLDGLPGQQFWRIIPPGAQLVRSAPDAVFQGVVFEKPSKTASQSPLLRVPDFAALSDPGSDPESDPDLLGVVGSPVGQCSTDLDPALYPEGGPGGTTPQGVKNRAPPPPEKPSTPPENLSVEAIERGDWEEARPQNANALAIALRQVWIDEVWTAWAGGGEPPTRGVGSDLVEIHKALKDGATPRGIVDAFRGVSGHPWFAATLAKGAPATALRVILHTNAGKLYEELAAIGRKRRGQGVAADRNAAESAWVSLYASAFEVLAKGKRRAPTSYEAQRWGRTGCWDVVEVSDGPGGVVPVYGPAERKGFTWAEIARVDAAIRSMSLAAGNVAAGRIASDQVLEQFGTVGGQIAGAMQRRVVSEFKAFGEQIAAVVAVVAARQSQQEQEQV
jgi:hypothetical protein